MSIREVCPICEGFSKEEVYNLIAEDVCYWGTCKILILVCSKHADKKKKKRKK